MLDFSIWVSWCLTFGFVLVLMFWCLSCVICVCCGLEFDCMVTFFAFSFPGLVLNFDEFWWVLRLPVRVIDLTRRGVFGFVIC